MQTFPVMAIIKETSQELFCFLKQSSPFSPERNMIASICLLRLVTIIPVRCD
jgi:hypothetical protein